MPIKLRAMRKISKPSKSLRRQRCSALAKERMTIFEQRKRKKNARRGKRRRGKLKKKSSAGKKNAEGRSRNKKNFERRRRPSVQPSCAKEKERGHLQHQVVEILTMLLVHPNIFHRQGEVNQALVAAQEAVVDGAIALVMHGAIIQEGPVSREEDVMKVAIDPVTVIEVAEDTVEIEVVMDMAEIEVAEVTGEVADTATTGTEGPIDTRTIETEVEIGTSVVMNVGKCSREHNAIMSNNESYCLNYRYR